MLSVKGQVFLELIVARITLENTNWPFGVIEDQHIEHSILKMSALGLLAHSVRLLSYRTEITIHEIPISTTSPGRVKQKTQPKSYKT